MNKWFDGRTDYFPNSQLISLLFVLDATHATYTHGTKQEFKEKASIVRVVRMINIRSFYMCLTAGYQMKH